MREQGNQDGTGNAEVPDRGDKGRGQDKGKDKGKGKGKDKDRSRIGKPLAG
jgi:hypothetical protein